MIDQCEEVVSLSMLIKRVCFFDPVLLGKKCLFSVYGSSKKTIYNILSFYKNARKKTIFLKETKKVFGHFK